MAKTRTAAGTADLGPRLRSLRLRAHLTMRALARKAGVAVSYVSALEAGRAEPTLATLRKLLVALGTDLGPFFADDQPAPAGCVFRRHQMRSAGDAGRRYAFVLPARDDVRLVMLDEELFAGEKPAYEVLAGDLAGYVLSGDLRLDVKGEPMQILQPGDAFHVPAGRPVRGACHRGGSVRLVTVQLKRPRRPREAP
jgi:transcriptional regulator with XRE-family HTH domain